MPYSPEEIALLERERKRKQQSINNWGYTDAKRAERTPRLPPVRYSEVLQLFTTYALLLQVLFGGPTNNSHLAGLNDVRGQLKSMAGVQHRLKPMYFANVVWAVLDDACKHFSECMTMEALRSSTPSTIRWPRSGLAGVAQDMRGSQTIDYWTMPDEWRNVISSLTHQQSISERPPIADYDHGSRGGGGAGGAGSRGGGIGKRQQEPPGGGGAGAWSSGNDYGERRQQQGKGGGANSWKVKYPERYGKKENPSVDAIVAKYTAPLRLSNGNLPLAQILRAGNITRKEAAKWQGIQEGICASYSTGYCGNPNCTFQHLFQNELPTGYPKHLCNILDKGKEASRKRKCEETGDPGKEDEE
jgi:hypothetical protein